VSVSVPRQAARRPVLGAGAVLAGCLALAGASLLAPSTPTTDPWGWLVWGREILHLDLSTAVAGAPSWKPLPVLVTTPLGLTGGAAPTLWLLFVRAASLLSLVMGFRLASRLGGPGAGALAAVGLFMSGGWTLGVAHGYVEALTAGLLFLAIERELDGHSEQALALGALIALARPEAFGLLAVFAAIQWRRARVRPPVGLLLLGCVPLLWIVPDWIGSGHLFHASAVSHKVVPTGISASASAVGEAALNPSLPLSACALAFIAFDRRGRSGAYGAIALLALVWAVFLAALMFGAGYPASGRFFDPVTALITILGAVAAVRLAARLAPRSPALAAGMAVAIAVATVGLGVGRTVDEARATLVRGRLMDQLHGVVNRAGRDALRRCRRTLLPGEMGWARGAVAWDLHVPLRRVRGVWTSAPDYIKDLGAHELEGTPPVPSAPVRIGRLKRNAALLLPFRGTRVTRARRLKKPIRLRVLAVDGRWTAYAVGRAPCLPQGSGLTSATKPGIRGPGAR
jgi:hypothetical protein